MGCKLSILLLFCLAIFFISFVNVNASHVSCGQTITQDTVLDNDLFCFSSGLTIGADNIILDCANHIIFGLETGISLTNLQGITIKNCNLQGWNEGIKLTNSANNIINNNYLLYNVYGIYLQSSSSNTIANNLGENNTEHIRLYQGSSNNNIINNTLRFNKYTSGVSGEGVHVRSSSNNNLISNNNISDMDGSGGYVYGLGIEVIDNSDYNIVSNNKVYNSASTNIRVYDSIGNIVENNDVAFLGCCSSINAGILVEAGSSNILRNNIASFLPKGILIEGEPALGWNSTNITVVNNTIISSEIGIGIYSKESYFLNNHLISNGNGIIVGKSDSNHISNNIIMGDNIQYSSGLFVGTIFILPL